MGLFSYIKKRKRNAVLPILLFIPFKGLVHSWILDVTFDKAMRYSIWLYYSELKIWVVSVILFAMEQSWLNKLNTSYYLTDGRILDDGIIEGKDVRCRITITNLVVEYDFSRGHPSSGYLWMAGDQNNLTEFVFKNNGKKRNGWINEEQYVISSTIEKLFQQSTKYDIKFDDDW